MSDRCQDGRDASVPGTRLETSEIVMGVRWEAEEHPRRSRGRQFDLDAFCLLFDARSRLVEVIHPGRLRNANGSVIHTGDSTTGASEWDDERIFVFLDPLPEDVAAVAFVVISATGRLFGETPGASCHVSDGATEREYLRVDLAAYGVSVARCIATLQRFDGAWRIFDRAESAEMALAAESLSLSTNTKGAG